MRITTGPLAIAVAGTSTCTLLSAGMRTWPTLPTSSRGGAGVRPIRTDTAWVRSLETVSGMVPDLLPNV